MKGERTEIIVVLCGCLKKERCTEIFLNNQLTLRLRSEQEPTGPFVPSRCSVWLQVIPANEVTIWGTRLGSILVMCAGLKLSYRLQLAERKRTPVQNASRFYTLTTSTWILLELFLGPFLLKPPHHPMSQWTLVIMNIQQCKALAKTVVGKCHWLGENYFIQS